MDCTALVCDRYGHLNNDLTGWLETKCQYKCSECSKYAVFIERTYVFIQSGYYGLKARPYNTSSLISDVDPKWRRCTPDYWTGVTGNENRDRHTWDGKCFCCGCLTEILVKGSEGFAGACGHSSLYGVTFCRKCNLKYDAEEHDD